MAGVRRLRDPRGRAPGALLRDEHEYVRRQDERSLARGRRRAQAPRLPLLPRWDAADGVREARPRLLPRHRRAGGLLHGRRFARGRRVAQRRRRRLHDGGDERQAPRRRGGGRAPHACRAGYAGREAPPRALRLGRAAGPRIRRGRSRRARGRGPLRPLPRHAHRAAARARGCRPHAHAPLLRQLGGHDAHLDGRLREPVPPLHRLRRAPRAAPPRRVPQGGCRRARDLPARLPPRAQRHVPRELLRHARAPRPRPRHGPRLRVGRARLPSSARPTSSPSSA